MLTISGRVTYITCNLVVIDGKKVNRANIADKVKDTDVGKYKTYKLKRADS